MARANVRYFTFTGHSFGQSACLAGSRAPVGSIYEWLITYSLDDRSTQTHRPFDFALGWGLYEEILRDWTLPKPEDMLQCSERPLPVGQHLFCPRHIVAGHGTGLFGQGID